ncbi:MAG TPA: hypothetical protein VMZ29_05765 [Candidatus Bathyarchaeia archaeon]|nr:hypothetical protein [Candidatus Bathyarchaeia archaeon]
MEEINEKLDKILFWLEFIGKKEVKEFIQTILLEPKEIVLYQNSDGNNGYNELTKISKLTQIKIQELWNYWTEIGIMYKIPAGPGERGVRKYNLLELGIKIPKNNDK